MATQAERAAYITRIRALPGHLETLTQGLTAEQLTAHTMENEWSVAQNIHHLADSHMNSFIRVKLLLNEEHPVFKPYNQDDWAASADADNPDISLSLNLLKGLHARWALLFESLTEEQWLRWGYHPEADREMTTEFIAGFYANHGEAHLDQITRTLAAGGIQRRNPVA